MPAVLLPQGPKTNAIAAKVVKKGGLLVFPTDTVYGLGCDPLNSGAIRKLFAVKGRGAKAVPVLCASMLEAKALVELSPNAVELARRHWPGALTIVAPVAREIPSELGQGTGTLGVRVPGSEACIDLIKACGGILVGTSANVSGMPSARTASEAMEQLGSKVDLFIEGGRLEGQESTVVKVVGDDIIVLRKGSVGVSRT